MDKSQVIIISGVTASGKTTLINELHKEIPSSTIISFDDYSIDKLDTAPRLGDILDNPELYVNQYDISLLMADFFASYNKVPVILIDFPFGYQHDMLRPYINKVVYIKTPLDITFARQLVRDYQKRTSEEIIQWSKDYLNFARPIFKAHERSISSTADLLLDGELPLDQQIFKVKQLIY